MVSKESKGKKGELRGGNINKAFHKFVRLTDYVTFRCNLRLHHDSTERSSMAKKNGVVREAV